MGNNGEFVGLGEDIVGGDIFQVKDVSGSLRQTC